MKRLILGAVVALCCFSPHLYAAIGSTDLIAISASPLSPFDAGDVVGEVDWEWTLSGGIYTYDYQVEPFLGYDGIHTFTLYTFGYPILTQTALAGDIDGGLETQIAASGWDYNPLTGIAHWYFATPNIDGTEQSNILRLTSLYGPVNGEAGTQDSVTAGAVPVPVPGVPVPGAALLVGLGLGLVGWFKRRFA